MEFKKIYFIVNPIAGKGHGKQTKKKIEEIFSDQNIQIKLTKKKDDAYNFALNALEDGAELVVSCGGDGTLNEVASALVGKQVPLAIVPIGSGNGLAQHMKIPSHPEEALQLIAESKKIIKKIDSGKINDSHFFGSAGLGFDAEAINIYASQKRRLLLGYLKSITLCMLKFKPIHISLTSEEMNFNGKVMMVNSSNTNRMGFGFSITPHASLEDGLLDVNLIPKCSWPAFIWIGLGFLFRQNWGKKRIQFRSKKINIESSTNHIQFDGEFHIIQSKSIEITILPQTLSLLIG